MPKPGERLAGLYLTGACDIDHSSLGLILLLCPLANDQAQPIRGLAPGGGARGVALERAVSVYQPRRRRELQSLLSGGGCAQSSTGHSDHARDTVLLRRFLRQADAHFNA